ncbi:MAG TPA: hypothetical protein VFX89_09535 [Gammaproteobacteria bacterium]|nr:hypothetical protein [Gammaproteobacteria bacterium]
MALALAAATLAAGSAAAQAPKPARDLKAGTTSYRAAIAIGGQSVDVQLGQKIEDGAGGWTVTQTLTTPFGDTVDSAVLAKGSLALVSRSVTQAGVAMSYKVDGGKVTGELKLPDQTVPLALDVPSGGLVGDGPGMAAVVGTLPLADGYAATLQMVNPQAQKIAPVAMRVVGSERVEVPAGAFDAFKVAFESEMATGTLWIAKDTHAPLKSITSAQGAQVTAELLE